MRYFTKRTGKSGNPLAPIFTLHEGKKSSKSKALKNKKREHPISNTTYMQGEKGSLGYN